MKRTISKETAKKLAEIVRNSEYTCTFENWREKLAEFHKDCNTSEDTGCSLLGSRWAQTIYDKEDAEMIADMLENAETPFDALGTILEFGNIPPPELLLVIDEMFKTYIISQGELTWEEACFGKPPRGVGVYAIRSWQNSDGDFKLFEKLVNENEQSENPVSQQILAENLFEKRRSRYEENKIPSPDIDSFLRKFRRWRKKARTIKRFNCP